MEPIAAKKFVRLVFLRLVGKFGPRGLPVAPTDSTGVLLLRLRLLTDQLSAVVRSGGTA